VLHLRVGPAASGPAVDVMLSLEVAKLREGSAPLTREIAPAELAPESDYRLLAPVVLAATVTREKERVAIAGTAATTLELSCGRCLESFALPVTARFDLRYLPFEDAPASDGEVEVADEDINTAYYHDGRIDLGELIHEQLYLVLPMKPLCKEDCQGLCPQCGANRNTAPCSCEHRWTDPRLAGLKALLNENDDA
jgi:uncharacterized protein